MAMYEQVCEMIIESVEKDSWKALLGVLKKAAGRLKSIEKQYSLEEVPQIALIGEIYVRRDGFSRQRLVERLAEKDIIVRTAPVAEWIYYCDYIVKYRLVVKSALNDRVRSYLQELFKNPFEKAIKQIFASSGFFEMHLLNVAELIDNVSDLISPRFTGETILTVGAAITEMVEEVDGVLSIGPFGCMPGRISEAVIGETLCRKKLEIAKDRELVAKVMDNYPSLPFLSIETDGNMFPQVIESRLEAFCLQVRRLHERIGEIRAERLNL